ncbi:unnamed protein product [Eruca vesicaria subsp. sativa]|uniref:RBR-type E3 ubiquitin transferase n=1 Tax=Eruca vesicaria subsp. sativa TaxID=29727 RepID=A0ABC8JVM6_ERUVS|nr:unnamed protein product [Eruca vesicaria subsp. sativa]
MGTCFSSSSSSHTRMEDYYNFDKVHQRYRWDYHFQEPLFSSLVSSSISQTNHHPQPHSHIATLTNQKEPELNTYNKPAEPSRSIESWEKTFLNHEEAEEPSTLLSCMICMDEKSPSDIFRGTTSCTHYYCIECTIRYVTSKVEENIAMIKCPDVECTRLLEPYTCRDIIPGDVFERWDKALCESLILSSEKVYCPFEDCSAMMVVDDDDQGNEVRETECPSCHRLFCAQCKVTWHAGIGCEEVQRVGNTREKNNSDKEDAMLIQMAKQKQWRRCPSCKFYVEKIDGCVHMSCRCGFKFCYRCGAASSYGHSCHIRSIFF